MRNLNLDQLQTLIAIADLGTLAAAAQALHLSAPTVSLHVSELESRLGVTLLHRGRHATRHAGGHAAAADAGAEYAVRLKRSSCSDGSSPAAKGSLYHQYSAHRTRRQAGIDPYAQC